MNSNAHTIRRTIAAFAAATACFAFAACGSEVSPPAQDIGGTQEQKHETTPPIPPRTSPTRGDFDDDYGTPDPRPQKKAPIDPIDRTKDWH